MRRKSKLFSLFVVLLLSLECELLCNLKQMPVHLFFNGKQKEVIELILDKNNAYLSDKIFKKYYGGALSFHSGCFLWKKNGQTVIFEINSSTIICDGEALVFKNKTLSVSRHLLIPFEFLISKQFENLSKTKTSWYSATRVVSIRTDRQVDTIELLKKQIGNIRTIIIDPGHGGHDIGAKAKNTTIYEKDINLKVAKYLQEMMKKNETFKTIMTRETDAFIPLDERTRIAGDNKADIFISIHANACREKKRRGFEIYFLSEKASDEEAEEVAVYENSVIDLDENADFKKKNLESILMSMGQNEFMNESSELAYFISEKVSGKKVILNRGIKQASLFVLRWVMCPSVLVELGYMTNKKDLKLIQKEKFQKAMAKLIYDGIVKYFERQEKNKPGGFY